MVKQLQNYFLLHIREKKKTEEENSAASEWTAQHTSSTLNRTAPSLPVTAGAAAAASRALPAPIEVSRIGHVGRPHGCGRSRRGRLPSVAAPLPVPAAVLLAVVTAGGGVAISGALPGLGGRSAALFLVQEVESSQSNLGIGPLLTMYRILTPGLKQRVHESTHGGILDTRQ
jgi:hypothetical protein